MNKNIDKYMWIMFGWAVWDALGSATEFLRPGMFAHLTDMIWSIKFKTKPWEWTDDTSMTLCLAQSLIECKWFDIEDQLDKYSLRLYDWYMSSNGKAFDIWIQTINQLFKYKTYKESDNKAKPWEVDLSWFKKDWNGAIMRIAPIALYYKDNIEDAIFYAWESVKTTHNTDICIDTAKYFIWMVIWLLSWDSKEKVLSPNYSPINNYRKDHKINPELEKITNWSYKNITEDKLWIQFGYILDSLQVALWGLYKFDSFEEGMINIVNLWYDADTNWCIYWFLAGAYYGYDNIPDRRKNKIAKPDLIKEITINLINKSSI